MTRARRPGRRVLAAGLAAGLLAGAGGCSSKGGMTPGGGGGDPGGAARSCEGIRGKVEQLYRAEAQAKEPRRVDEAVADNTTMVMNDCAKAPTKVARCVDEVSTVAELEKRCLVPLDDEGTEGEELRR